MMEQNNAHCTSCDLDFVFQPEEAWFDEKGYGYSTKLVRCPDCNKIVIVKHIEDYGFSNMNIDERYF